MNATDAMIVANTCTREVCPFCRSRKIRHMGSIRYPSPVLFSTTTIVVSAVPQLWRCAECGSKFTQNALPEQDAAALYRKGESGARWQSERFQDSHCNEVVHALTACLERGGRVVDVGCNTGEFLDFARSLGCETAGIEYSESSQRILRAKGHLLHPDLQSLPDRSLDVITAFDVVEHLYHPAEFLATCRAKLRTGGRLVLLTGNPLCLGARIAGADWWYVRFPEHIVFPSRRYFAQCSPLALERFVPTYAGRRFKRPAWEVLRDTIYLMRTGNFAASPAIGPDHMLVILRRIDDSPAVGCVAGSRGKNT